MYRRIQCASRLSAVAIAALILVPASALACTAAPPPHWPSVIKRDVPVAIGRVVSITPVSHPVTTEIFEMAQTDAVIERVEVVHGDVPDHALFRATSEARVREGQVAPDGWCGRMMDVNVGEIVLVMENSPGV